MTYELPALPYAKDALAPVISAETIDYHYGKHHQAYVTNLNNLVPGIPDEAYEMAFNPDDGNLYFVSNDTADSRVFVSAVSLPADAFDAAELGNDSVVTYVDLDPNSANTYLEVTYDASGEPDTPGQNLFVSGGITFAPDGSRMYLSNSIGASPSSQNRVFVLKMVPEPATMGLLLLGSTALALLRKRKR